MKEPTHAQRYKWGGLSKGLTVAEWERLAGLPPYSVAPQAKGLTDVMDRGFFMYRRPTYEETFLLDAQLLRAQGRPRKAVDPATQLEARRAKNKADAARYHEKKANAA